MCTRALLPVAQRKMIFSPSRNHNLWFFLLTSELFRAHALGTVDDNCLESRASTMMTKDGPVVLIRN